MACLTLICIVCVRSPLEPGVAPPFAVVFSGAGIEVSDDPAGLRGEGWDGRDAAVGQQARNCPVRRAFSSGAVEEQSAEGALPVWDSLTSCEAVVEVEGSVALHSDETGGGFNSDAERDKAWCFQGQASELCVPCRTLVQVCVSYSDHLRFNT